MAKHFRVAHQHLLFGLLAGLSGCAGRAQAEAPSAGAGGAVAAGTAGTLSASGGRSGGTMTTSGGSVGQGGSGGVDWTACSSQDSCVLETQTACGAGCEPVPLSRFAAINARYEDDYRKNQPVPPCIAPMCPDLPRGAANTPNYYATCESGHCQALDVRTTSLSACSSDAECYLRSGTSCCGCGRDPLISVSRRANPEQAFCGNRACAADCAIGAPPGTASAICVAGHCLVDYAVDAGPAP